MTKTINSLITISTAFLVFVTMAGGQGVSGGGSGQAGRGRGSAGGPQGTDVTASYSFNQAAVQRGQAEFGTACASCHGADARGGGKGQAADDLLRSVIVLDDVGGQEIGEFLKYGRPEKGMPKVAMTTAQVSDIASFLHYDIARIAERGSYHYQDILVGNAAAGKAYFNGPGGCTQCHSVTGDLKGIAGKYTPPEIQNRIISGGGASGRRFGNLGEASGTEKTATITLPSGQAVSGPLMFVNDYVITIQDAAGAPHSFFRDGDSPKVVIKNPLAAHVKLGRTLADKDMHNLTAYLETLK